MEGETFFSGLKMSLSYAPPPGISSGALRILKPDYPEESLPTEAHGQRGLITDHVVVLSPSPPEQSDLRAMEHSTNNIGGIDKGVLLETYGPPAGSFSDLVHPNYSETGNSLLDQYYSNAEGPRLSGINQRPGSMIGIGSSTGTNTKLDQLNPKNSLTGISLRNAYNQYNINNQFDPVDEDLDFDDYIK